MRYTVAALAGFLFGFLFGGMRSDAELSAIDRMLLRTTLQWKAIECDTTDLVTCRAANATCVEAVAEVARMQDGCARFFSLPLPK